MRDDRPVVFLDIDGVLVTARSWSTPARVDRSAVVALNLLTERTGAAIVLSSTWRFLPSVKTILRKAGVVGPIIGKTPRDGYSRGAEIATWLHRHGGLMRRYVILDDDTDMDPLGVAHLVRTTFDLGLTLIHVAQAEHVLNGEVAVR